MSKCCPPIQRAEGRRRRRPKYCVNARAKSSPTTHLRSPTRATATTITPPVPRPNLWASANSMTLRACAPATMATTNPNARVAAVAARTPQPHPLHRPPPRVETAHPRAPIHPMTIRLRPARLRPATIPHRIPRRARRAAPRPGRSAVRAVRVRAPVRVRAVRIRANVRVVAIKAVPIRVRRCAIRRVPNAAHANRRFRVPNAANAAQLTVRANRRFHAPNNATKCAASTCSALSDNFKHPKSRQVLAAPFVLRFSFS